MILDHDLARPGWTCKQCRRDWPCREARNELLRRFSRMQLAVLMADYLHLAARDMADAQPGSLFDRLLLWTREPPPTD